MPKGKQTKTNVNKKGVQHTADEDWAKDFVFPIFCDDEKEKNLNKKIKRIKSKSKLSPHVVNLRNPTKPTSTSDVSPAPTMFNPENWFANFQLPATQQPPQEKKIDFELPENPEPVIKKVEYHKPTKHKIKSRVKLGLGQDMLFVEQEIKRAKIKALREEIVVWKTIKKIFAIFWAIISFPFRALDFLVDRTLKGIWWSIKFIILSFINLLKAMLSNLQNLLTAPKTTEVKIRMQPFQWRKINYKPILSFTLICLVVILPLQIFNLIQKSSQLKGQVLGKSIAGLDALKNASMLGINLDFEQAQAEFQQAYFNFQLAQNYLDGLGIFSQQIIKIVPEANQADNLLIIGQLAAQLGQDLTGLAQQLEQVGETENGEVKILQKVRLTSQMLRNIEPYFLELLERADKIDVQTLSKHIDEENLEKLILFKSSLPILKQNFDQLKILNKFLSDFLGQDKAQKYLVIFQNNSELRPTGGFMGSYALVEIKNGKIINMQVPGGGFYDLKAGNQTMVEAPKPFHLFSPYWQIWNANWFPDWPESAQKIAWFYEHSLSGITVDGIITLTPDVIEDLLEITGAVEMLDYEKIITADNFVKEVQMAVEIEYDKEENQPKKFIADLMPKVLERVFNLSLEQTPAFITALNQNLAQKNILFWFKDEEMQQVIQNFDWSGQIKSSQGDYLMVVHTNIGGGKTDRVVDNKIMHKVEVDEIGNIFNTVTLTKTHNGKVGDIFENQNNVDYVRFYVPQGSQLMYADGFDYLPNNLFKIAANYKTLEPDPDLNRIEQNPILDEKYNMRITQEFGKTVFGNWIQVEPGQETTVSIKYQLPFNLHKAEKNFLEKLIDFIKPAEEKILRYNLIIQKQPGLNSTDFISQLYLPANYQIVNSHAKNNTNIANNIVTYQDNLETDGYYGVEIK